MKHCKSQEVQKLSLMMGQNVPESLQQSRAQTREIEWPINPDTRLELDMVLVYRSASEHHCH